MFVSSVDGKIRLLSYPSFEPAMRLPYASQDGEADEFALKGHTASCLTADLSPTGRYLATGGADSTMALFDTQDWICQRTVTRMPGPVRSISTSRNWFSRKAAWSEGGEGHSTLTWGQVLPGMAATWWQDAMRVRLRLGPDPAMMG